MLALPYIGEAMVVGVPDDEFGQRVGAVLTLRSDAAAQEFYREWNRVFGKVDLGELREDLQARLAGYKLPTLLCVVEGEIPKSATGKVVKRTLGPEYFRPNYEEDPEVQRRNPNTSKL
jgi:malonyl-CoA/methylmalonyl-CoA synthetase